MKSISPEHLSYIIGFLQGDGNNYRQSRNRGKICVEISHRDKDILDKMEECIENIHVGRGERKRDTNFKNECESCSLSLYDLETRTYLSQFIPTGKKSDAIRPPDGEDFFDRYAYVRGLTDADGSIGMTSQNRPFWSLCTSSDFVKDFIINDIKQSLDFEKRINRNKRDNVYNIVLYDEDSIEYTSLIYGDATIFSTRKHKMFLQISKWKRSKPKRKGRKKAWLPYEYDVITNISIPMKDKMRMLGRSRKSIQTQLWRLRQK